MSTDNSSDDERINDIILDEPMFYILTQFFETKNGKNITTVLEDLVSEIKQLRLAVQTSVTISSSVASAPARTTSQADASGID
jgi:hypothetical protein